MAGHLRLGELLLGDGIVTLEQVASALERQVIQGGRIGTNLVEAYHVNLDLIANKLAIQHQMPAATGAHFENANVEIQRRLDPALAHTFKAVPIGHISADTIAVACMNPLPADAIALIGSALGFKAIAAIAPELRIRYQLEKVYDVRRTARFLRVRSDAASLAPSTPPDVEQPAGPVVSKRPEIENKRRYIQTLSDLPSVEDVSLDHDISMDEDVSMDHDVSLEDVSLEPSREIRSQKSLGRIALKRTGPESQSSTSLVAVSLGAEREPEHDTSSLRHNLRQVRRATSRDAVAEVVIKAMRDGIDQVIDAGILFINRRNVAIPWKGFIRGSGGAEVDKVVVPMAHPSVLSEAFQTRKIVRRTVGEQCTPMDQRIWAVMGVEEPVEVIVLPMVLDDHIVGLVYAQSAQLGGLDDAAAHVLRELTKAMVRGFRRLIQAAQR